MSNPFTQVFDALWALFEQWPDIDTLVPVGNRIKVNSDTNRAPIKKMESSADYPRVMLYGTTAQVNMHASSSSSRVIRQYAWAIASGDLRYAAILSEIEWALFVSMCNWKSALTALTWNSRHFVKRADLVSVNTSLFEPSPAKVTGLKGWSSGWTCEVHMEFNTAALVDLLGSSSGGS